MKERKKEGITDDTVRKLAQIWHMVTGWMIKERGTLVWIFYD